MNIFLILTVFMISTLHAIANEELSKTTLTTENGLRPKVLIAGETLARANILERMKYYKVPGVSIALINNGKVEWSKGYGRITNDPKSARIDEHTLFQAGSISKPVSAFGALLLTGQNLSRCGR
ncbi:MAG: serine hydrolase [Parachlamydiaceae bacterium]|nr:serine hydrolase [Parachlamydiaceae bacterium]